MCDLRFCQDYNCFVFYEECVDVVLGFFDLFWGKWLSLIMFYFEFFDMLGYEIGFDVLQIIVVVVCIDDMIGWFFEGFGKWGLVEDVIVILVGDYGMVVKCEGRMIYFEDFGFEVKIFREWVMDYSFVFQI